MAYLVGQGGKVTVGTTDYDVESWSVNVSNEAQDITTTGSNGWMENLAGINKIEASVKAFWDAADKPTDVGGLNIRPGVSAAVKLYVGNSTKFFSFEALITKINVEHAAKSVVPFSFDCVGTGALTYPS